MGDALPCSAWLCKLSRASRGSVWYGCSAHRVVAYARAQAPWLRGVTNANVLQYWDTLLRLAPPAPPALPAPVLALPAPFPALPAPVLALPAPRAPDAAPGSGDGGPQPVGGPGRPGGARAEGPARGRKRARPRIRSTAAAADRDEADAAQAACGSCAGAAAGGVRGPLSPGAGEGVQLGLKPESDMGAPAARRQGAARLQRAAACGKATVPRRAADPAEELLSSDSDVDAYIRLPAEVACLRELRERGLGL